VECSNISLASGIVICLGDGKGGGGFFFSGQIRLLVGILTIGRQKMRINGFWHMLKGMSRSEEKG